MRLCLSCHRSLPAADWLCPQCGWKPGERSGLIYFAPESAIENEGFPPEDFDLIVGFEDKHPWFQSRNSLLLWAFRKYFPAARNFYEVGCGNGFVLAAFEKNFPLLKLTGSEIYSQGLSHAWKRLEKAELYQTDAKQELFESEFDVLGAFDVLEHIREDERVLANFNQALVPGGGLLLTVPQHPFLWSYEDEYARHVCRYRRSDLKAKLEKTGFQVLDQISFVSILLPVMLLSRRLISKNNYDPKREMELSPLVRFVMGNLLGLERGLIRLGLRFPFGGSLLMIARKI